MTPLNAPRRDPAYGVVLLNWNNATDSIAALDSLRAAVPAPLEVALVDNGSTDDSITRISDWARTNSVPTRPPDGDAEVAYDRAWLTFIRLERNLGFSGGCNAGVKFMLERTDVTHVLLLNNDAMVEKRFFGELTKALQSVPEAGLLTGTIYTHPDRSKVWYAGGREVPFRALIEHLLVVPDAATPIATEFVSGCAMLIGRPVIEKIGLLPEVYFPGYSEDAEYSLRARAAGFPVLYVPHAIVYHKVGATAGAAKTSAYITRAQIRHRVLYVRRNFRGLNRYVALGYLCATKPAKALAEALSGRPKMGWAVFAGAVEGFLHSDS